MKQEFKHIVSLGSTCLPRILPTRQGFKLTEEQGELALPFDLAGHMYDAVCEIIESGFEDYCNSSFYEMDEDSYGLPIVRHTKYDMWFAHEIHGSKQKFFTDNDYAMLTALYKRKINNFYKYVEDGDILFFTHNHYLESGDILFDSNYHGYPGRLNQILRSAFPALNYKILALSTFAPSKFSSDKFYPVEKYDDEIEFHCIPFPADDYLWWQPEHYENDLGVQFENRIGDILSKYVERINPPGTIHVECQD